MRKSIFIGILGLFILTGCGTGEFSPTNGKFTVSDLTTTMNKDIYEYRIDGIKCHVYFFLQDSANRYKIGDTLTLIKN